MTKKCSKCKLVCSKSDFNPDSRAKDGLQSQCKQCQLLANIKWQNSEQGKNKHLLSVLKYQKNHPDVLVKSRRNFYERNKDDYRKRQSEWKIKNKGKVNFWNTKRRINKKSQTPSWANLEAIKQIYINCPKGYEVDHIIPLQGQTVCGFHVEYNLQYLTKSDNCKKGNKLC